MTAQSGEVRPYLFSFYLPFFPPPIAGFPFSLYYSPLCGRCFCCRSAGMAGKNGRTHTHTQGYSFDNFGLNTRTHTLGRIIRGFLRQNNSLDAQPQQTSFYFFIWLNFSWPATVAAFVSFKWKCVAESPKTRHRSTFLPFFSFCCCCLEHFPTVCNMQRAATVLENTKGGLFLNAQQSTGQSRISCLLF